MHAVERPATPREPAGTNVPRRPRPRPSESPDSPAGLRNTVTAALAGDEHARDWSAMTQEDQDAMIAANRGLAGVLAQRRRFLLADHASLPALVGTALRARNLL